MKLPNIKFVFVQRRLNVGRWTSIAVSSGSLIVATGCGGQSAISSSGTSNPVVGGVTTSVGALSVTLSGRAKPLVTSSGEFVSTFAQGGASYSNIACNPAKNLADTFLLVERVSNFIGDTLRLPVTGGAETPLVSGAASRFWESPSPAQNGEIALVDESSSTGWSVLPDGSGLKLALGPNLATGIALSPNGSTCVNNWKGTLYVQPYGGVSPGQKIGINASWNEYGTLAISPNGTTVAGIGLDGELYTAPITAGSSATTILSGTTWSSVSWSPDGGTLLGTYIATSPTQNEILKYNIATGQSVGLTSNSYNESLPVFSPDGSKIAFYRDSTGGATPGIYLENRDGVGAQLLEADPPGSYVAGLAWSSFLPNKTFIGSGGVLGASASGFIYSQCENQFASLATFIAKTPTTATVTAPGSGNGYGAILYTLSADSISQVDYTNAYIGQTIAVSVNGPTAVVSVDGQTGAIDLVVAAAIPARVSKTGTTNVLDGKFTALYDAKGKNIAPAGAQHVEIDKSGKLVSFR